MFTKFENDIAILTERKTTMGLEEFLLNTAEKKGVEKGIKETALKMKKGGVDINLIAIFSGLTIEEIEKL